MRNFVLIFLLYSWGSLFEGSQFVPLMNDPALAARTINGPPKTRDGIVFKVLTTGGRGAYSRANLGGHRVPLHPEP